MKDNSTRNLIVAMAVTAPLMLGVVIGGDQWQQHKEGLSDSNIPIEIQSEIIEHIPERVFDATDVGNNVVKYAYFSDNEVPTFEGEDIQKRTPTSWAKTQGKDRNGVDLGNGVEEITLFSQGAFVKMSNGKWYNTEFATTTKEKFKLQKDKTQIKEAKEIGMYGFIRVAYAQEPPFYPDPHIESTSVDGYVNLTNAVYLTLRNASNGASAMSAIDEIIIQHSKFGSLYYITRSFFLFDTSSLDDSATISSATFSLYYNATAQGDVDNENVVLVSSTPASNTNLVTEDYDQSGTTSFGSMDMEGTNGAYNDITINATGIATISKTGITKFGTKTDGDISATTPTGLNQRTANSAEHTGTDQDPKLVVTLAGGTPTTNYGNGPQLIWFN